MSVRALDFNEFIVDARNSFIAAKQGLMHALATTAVDRLDWSPSSTSRSPLRIAAHAALAVEYMLGNMTGDTFTITNTADADQYFLESERRLETIAQVEAELNANSDAYISWLGGLDPDALDALAPMPFGMGEVPMRLAISFMPAHLQWHTAQIFYIQTIYGDRDWHL